MISQLSDALSLDEKGIYTSNKRSTISYPEDQNALCMQFEETSFWFKHRNHSIIEMIKHFPSKGPIMDIGGGNGFVAKGLQDADIETLLLEPGETGAYNAKQRGIKTVICSTFQDAEIKSEALSGAAMFDVIEHIEDDGRILKTIHKTLEPDGMVYFSVPAYQWLWSHVDEDAGHYRRYTKKSMTKLLADNGFTVVYSTYIFSVLPVPIFLFRSLPSIFRKRQKHHEIASTKKEEHNKKSSLLEKLWHWEISILKKKKSIGFGGTLLIAAKKSK